MSTWSWDPNRPSEPPTANGVGGGEPVESPLPVHPLLWHPVRTRIDAERAPHSRLVGVEYTYDYQPSNTEFQQSLGKNDVVWVPLFDGTIHQPAHDFNQRRAEYDVNVKAIAEIAPKVQAVICGNANAEIRFADCTRAEEHERCLTFIESHCQFISMHGRPAFAPIFEILVQDCFEGNGALRDLLLQNNALLISFAGSSWLYEQQGDHPRIPEPWPYPTLQKYIASLEAWSGVSTLRGLRAGSGEVIKSMGYSAGFAGWF